MDTPENHSPGGGASDKELRTKLRDTRQRLHKMREGLEKKNTRIERQQQNLETVNEQLANAEEQIAGLRMALAQAQGTELSSALDTETPVFFMVGRGRSGTTWLQNTLNAHPEVLCKGEGRFFDRKFRRDDYKNVPLRNAPVSSLYNAIAESEYLRLWIERRLIWSRGRSVEEHLDNLTRMAIDYFMAEQLSKSVKRIVGDKTPFAWEEVMTDLADSPKDASLLSSADVLAEIGRIYPGSKVIHVIRDGRDVAVSTMHFMWNLAKSEGGLYPLKPEELEVRDKYREDPSSFTGSLFVERRLASLAKGWSIEVRRTVERGPALLGDRYAEVRYEDLQLHPEKELGRLLEFIGADAGEQVVRDCIEATNFEKLSKRGKGEEDSSSRTYRKGVIGDWENIFTQEDREIFKGQAGDLLMELGYEDDKSW